MTTTTKALTVRKFINDSNPNVLADALKPARLGDMLSVVKVVVSGLTSTATVNLSSAAVKAAITSLTGLDPLAANEFLPAIGSLLTLRPTAGTAGALTAHVLVDDAGTATAGTPISTARISDDGKTLTFNAPITAFVIEYMPRAAGSLDAILETGA
jgi:hypothetical protein